MIAQKDKAEEVLNKIQKEIDEWHKRNKGKELNKKEYLDFLKSISYIVEENEDFNIETVNVDDENVSLVAMPGTYQSGEKMRENKSGYMTVKMFVNHNSVRCSAALNALTI